MIFAVCLTFSDCSRCRVTVAAPLLTSAGARALVVAQAAGGGRARVGARSARGARVGVDAAARVGLHRDVAGHALAARDARRAARSVASGGHAAPARGGCS